jgi:predicted short-subunit dehydrogenase-like oxidoreductase (DUF2520 family)
LESIVITIIGTGNLATNLISEFKKTGATIFVNGRDKDSLTFLADTFRVGSSFGFENLPENSDIYFICISDEAVHEIINDETLRAKINNGFIVHTCGSIPLQLLSKLSNNYGVFYPLQTFTKEIKTDFKHVPICIEANNGYNQDKLIKYATQISDDVRRVSSEQRQFIHLAAVFANNFTNKMFSIAEEILNEHQIDFNILIPIIEESIRKIRLYSPRNIQTGPAIRNDFKTMEKHLELLKDHEDFKHIYSIISKHISISK